MDQGLVKLCYVSPHSFPSVVGHCCGGWAWRKGLGLDVLSLDRRVKDTTTAVFRDDLRTAQTTGNLICIGAIDRTRDRQETLNH